MDKKNTLIGVLLLLAAAAVFFFGPKSPAPTQPNIAQPATAPGPVAGTATPSATVATAPVVRREPTEARAVKLANDFIEATLTNHGAAVREVAFKKYAAIQGRPEPYIFNHLHQDPILAIGGYPGLGRETAFEIVSSTANEAVFRAVIDGKLEVTRTYRLAGTGDEGAVPYLLVHETTFRNLTDATTAIGDITLSLGTAALLNERDYGQYLNAISFDGEDAQFIEQGQFDGGGFLSIFGGGRAPRDTIPVNGPVVWGGVKNQFFASVYTPENPGKGLVAQRLDLSAVAPFPDGARPNRAVTAAAQFDVPTLAANATVTLKGQLYVGPQEYKRLQTLEKDEDQLLPYTQYFFNRIFLSHYVAPLENTLLNFAHRFAGNWGVAVILMTLVLKIVSLPFTIAASRSAKRMAKLQPEMKAIREKYKDNPQKQQMATMELFKQHKVNPVGGCIPVLITMPLFVGFFAMLQGAAELRFQPFLWAPDLSAPDTVGHIFGLPINIMPILMGATMIVQMQLTPTPSVDKAQQMMMKFMPIIFTLFCYNFSCALALYSTINGLFTIGQQLVINRMNDDGDPAPVGPGTAAAATLGSMGRKVKNVTPKKK